MSVRKSIVFSAGLAMVCGLASSAMAETIAAWDFSSLTTSSNWGPSPYAPATTLYTQDPNLVASGTTTDGNTLNYLTRNWTNGTGTPAADAYGGNNFSTTATSEAMAISANDFISFAVEAQPGYQLSLSQIPAYNIRHSATGPVTGIWQYKVDGGSWTDIGSSIGWGSVTTTSGNPQNPIDLTGIAALQNVAGGTAVELRAVTWGATSTGGTWYFNDNGTYPNPAMSLEVDGSVTPASVPEPMTIVPACGGLFLAIGACIRRKVSK